MKEKTYKIIGGTLVNLPGARVGYIVKIYRGDHYERCLVLPFRRVFCLRAGRAEK